MASSPKLISMSILFLFALFSMQIHAREFFSKMPRVNSDDRETKTTTTTTKTVPETREQEHATFVPETTQKSEEQEPRFIPETQNGYGLYRHELDSGKPSFTTKETYEPYVTPVRYHPDEPYNSIPESSNNKNTYYSSKNAHPESTEQQNLAQASFTEKGWRTKENQNNHNYNYNYNRNNGYNNDEKLGMSDTRYLENGKYYYDVKSENNYYPNQFGNSRRVASRNEFDENRYNNMGRYYNKNQEEFENSEEEFEP